jgi:DNA-binding transcriptional ArsR family regulator
MGLMPATEGPMMLSLHQLECLASPIREQLVMTFLAYGPLTAKEIAAYTGRAQTSLYYHLKQLEDAGLVFVKEMRRVFKTDQAVYELAASRFELRDEMHNPAYRAAHLKIVAATMRLVYRMYQSAITEPTPSSMYETLNARITPEAARRLQVEIREAALRARAHEDPNGVPVSLLALMAPARRPGRKK